MAARSCSRRAPRVALAHPARQYLPGSSRMDTAPSTATAHAYVTAASSAPAFRMIGVLWRLQASGIQTGGSFCLLDQQCSPGSGPERHDHPQHEGLYVADGSVSFQAGGAAFKGRPGSWRSPVTPSTPSRSKRRRTLSTSTCRSGSRCSWSAERCRPRALTCRRPTCRCRRRP